MKDIIIKSEDLQNTLIESIPAILKDKFSSTYSNPLREVIDEEIKKEDGAIRLMIKKIISDSVTDKAFQEKLTGEVITKMITMALQK